MLYFLKLGGSLITKKDKIHSPQKEIIKRIGEEIRSALDIRPDLQLLIGHGSGSFGHIPAEKYATRQGVFNPEQWQGFFEVWKEAHSLNQIVMETFFKTKLPVISFPPSAGIIADNHKVIKWNIDPLDYALKSGLIPVIFGDVIFDQKLGGTILSTEELFIYLAKVMKPEKILLAGIEEGVWKDFPERNNLVKNISNSTYPKFKKHLHKSDSIDVTGGMETKVETMLTICRKIKNLEVQIFSGDQPMFIQEVLNGGYRGTLIKD
jgi:isopentenyl phosphate kinase